MGSKRKPTARELRAYMTVVGAALGLARAWHRLDPDYRESVEDIGKAHKRLRRAALAYARAVKGGRDASR